MEQRDILLSRTEDLANKAVKTGLAVSRFLTPAEAQSIASRFSKRKDAALVLDGGYEGAERVRAVFCNSYWGEYKRDELFSALKIIVSTQDELKHRDILGAVMALGIERNSIGDIISSPPVLICLPELGGYIAENLKRVGKTNIKLSNIDLAKIPTKNENFNIRTDTVASVRLDAVLSTAFGLPRSKAVELIEAGRVSLNYEISLKQSKEIAEGALLSVQGIGRAKLLEIGSISKKGRIFIKTGVFI